MQYLVFAGHNYYPDGGAHDFVGGYGTVEEAVGYAVHAKDGGDKDWAHVAQFQDNKLEIIWYPTLGFVDPEKP